MLGMSSLFTFGYFLANVNAANSSTGFVRFMKVYEYGQNTCAKEEQVFGLINATTVSCSSVCASDDNCESFFHFPISLRCDGCKQTNSTDGQLKGAGEETVYYTSTDTPKKYEYAGCYSIVCYSGQFSCEFSGRDVIQEVTPEKCFRKCDELVGATVGTIAIQVSDKGPSWSSCYLSHSQTDSCFCEQHYDTTEIGCNTVCSGNEEESCGGAGVASVYKLV